METWEWDQIVVRVGNNLDDARNMRKNYCVRNVNTLREGWPQYASLCDEIEHHPYEEFCNMYDAVMNKIHDTTAAIINDETEYEDID